MLRAMNLAGLMLLAATTFGCSGDAPEQGADGPGAAPAAQPKLLFTIGVHIEPFGTEISQLVPETIRLNQPKSRGIRSHHQAPRGKAAPGGGPAMDRPSPEALRSGEVPVPPGARADARPGGAGSGFEGSERVVIRDYNDPSNFDYHADDLRVFLDVVNRHDGKVVLQGQSPFSSQIVARDDGLFRDAVAKGHEVALHFHEGAHLGKTCLDLECDLWTEVIEEQVRVLRSAGAGDIVYWSGGNLYDDLLEAASGAGLKVMGDYKNPNQQAMDDRLLTLHPWRPAGSPQGEELGRLHEHDPNGPIVFLPSGLVDLVGSKNAANAMGPKATGNAHLLDAIQQSVDLALANLDPDKVNVMHFTVHPGEFDWEAELDPWLTKAIDPHVAAGRIEWATFSEQYEAYLAWEAAQ